VDVTAVFTKGTRIRWKDGGAYKYAVVTSSAYVTSTTVTFTGGSDYTMANATITDNYYSYIENPEGYPGLFNWAAAPTGYSVVPSSPVYRFLVRGHMVVLHMNEPNSGTSNSSDKDYTLPIAAIGTANLNWLAPSISVVDNSVISSDGYGQVLASAPTNLDAFKSVNGGGWTASGACHFAKSGFTIEYEMA
jgi:hypothetical protein